MSDLRRTASDWLTADRESVLITVTEALGSAPREAGTRMLVGAAHTAGTVGGGHLELQAIAQARAMLATGDTAPQSAHYQLGPALGQCCGGGQVNIRPGIAGPGLHDGIPKRSIPFTQYNMFRRLQRP